MEKSIVTTGKTIELAIEAALTELHMDRDSVSVEVLKNARAGFLGIGASPAEIKVTYQAPDEPSAPKTVLSSASRSKPKERPQTTSGVISRPGKKIEQPEPKKRPEQSKDRRPTQNTERPKQDKPAQTKTAPKPVKQPVQSAEPRTYVPAEPGSIEERIEEFLNGLLKHMGNDAVAHAYKLDKDIYRADLVGGDAGLLIGRRGDTLDAIQYLTGYAVNRDRSNRLRISVDAGDYRRKREEALTQLANKMAAKAVKYHRNFTLEPMNAYERHIIHAALQEYPEVTTFSTGTEPHRRIVVAYAKEK